MTDPTEVYTNDRDRLLAAIRAADPQDDTPRLAYADWLEEYGSTDLDKATLEFIRLSCRMSAAGKTKTMPREAYPWVRRNWKRFLPTLLAHNVPIEYNRKTAGNTRLEGMDDVIGWWAGRWAIIRLRLRRLMEQLPTHRFALQIEFWKGFVSEVNTWDRWDSPLGAEVKSLVRTDQPIARLGAVDDQTRAYLPNYG